MSSEEERNNLKFLAACEQASAGMRNVATIVSSYFLALTSAGLTSEESIRLTIEYQNFLFSLSKLNES